MCQNLLHWPPEGNECPSCQADNASEALYCASCGGPIGDEPAARRSLAEALNLVLGGEAAETSYEEEGYMEEAGEAEPPAVPDLDFEAPPAPEEPAEPPSAPPDEPAFEEPYEPVAPLAEEPEAFEAPPPPPGAPAAPPEEELPAFEELAIELDEAMEAGDEEEAPPPPPGAIDLDVAPGEPDEEPDSGGWTMEPDQEDES
jgi:hypothetical protein